MQLSNQNNRPKAYYRQQAAPPDGWFLSNQIARDKKKRGDKHESLGWYRVVVPAV
jgi:hypothetical protein